LDGYSVRCAARGWIAVVSEHLPGMQTLNLPKPNDIAQLLGLSYWQAGLHEIQNAKPIWVDFLWWVEVEPSFHAHWIVAGAVVNASGRNAPLWRKAALAKGSSVGVVDLPDATVEEAFNAAPLFRPSWSMSLDGIGYRVRTDSIAVYGEFRFANPAVAEWIAVEQALLAVGAAAAKASGAAALSDVLKLWREYASRP
jgi:hypothetical protein